MDSHELIIKLSTSSDGPHIFNEPIVSELNFLGGLFISGNDMIAGGGGIINKWKTLFEIIESSSQFVRLACLFAVRIPKGFGLRDYLEL